MDKKKFFLFFYLLFFISYLYSLSLTEERFLIINYSRNTLIISHEYLCNDDEIFWVQKLNNIDVRLTNWLRVEEVVLEPSSGFLGTISYMPIADNWNDYRRFFSFIHELPFGVKMREIFKTFSIRTIDGDYIIRDIEDLCIFNIRKVDLSYILEIYDM